MDMYDHTPISNDPENIPDNCETCGAAVHTDAKSGVLVHGFDPAL
jgi:hypothetical protein